MTGERFVATSDIKDAVRGREDDVLDGLGIQWRSARTHILCPYPTHADSSPSWRWDRRTPPRAHCSCDAGTHDIFEVARRMAGTDREGAKIRVAELIGRTDLIKTRRASRGARQGFDPESLLTPHADARDDSLVGDYLAFRLGVEPGAVVMPSTKTSGITSLAYYDPAPTGGAKPSLVGRFPCVVFQTISPDGRSHAHRIYVAPHGRDKAALGHLPDGTPRDPKKSAIVPKGDNISGLATLWGNTNTAEHIVLAEGIETAAALALTFAPEIADGTLLVAAAISAVGLEKFEPWPTTRRVTVAADRDEAAKPDGRPGSKRGERAAITFALRMHQHLDVRIALPGRPGESVDWLDILTRDGVPVVRAGITAALRFDPIAHANDETYRQSSRAWPFRLRPTGVERRVEHPDRDGGEPRIEWRWICSPLEVIAHTRLIDGRGGWGRLLQITDRDGIKQDWAMPAHLLAGDGNAYRERLLDLGLTIGNGKFARDGLHEYLSMANPEARVRCVTRTGWHGRSYVGFNGTISGPADQERYVLQTIGATDHAFRMAGTFEEWQADVARLAVGNSRLVLALCAAFAAALLHPTETDGVGFNIKGASSTGKSSTLRVSGSVWGGGGIKGYTRTWHATGNGLEALATTHSDAILLLDELGQVQPEEAASAAYMLASGQGKARAGQWGEGRPPAEWRCLFLSSGEIDLEAKLIEGARRQMVTAGQQVRVIDLPADAGVGLGVFEQLHGFVSAKELADHLRAASARHYGHAWDAFVRALVANYDAIAPTVRGHIEGFKAAYCPAGADGQVLRAADRFALLAAAGEMAAEWEIVPWPTSEATRGVGRCFSDWLMQRGGIGPAEDMRAIATVRRYIERYGNERFEAIGDLVPTGFNGQPLEQTVRNRLGFRRSSGDDGVEYCFLPELWKSEVCAGQDHNQVAKALHLAGHLRTASDRMTFQVRVPGVKDRIWVYLVRSSIMKSDDVPASRGSAAPSLKVVDNGKQ